MIIKLDSIELREELISPIDIASASKTPLLSPKWSKHETMLKIGGYSTLGIFHRICIPSLFFIYNIFNVIWACVQLNVWGWCLPTTIIFIIIQLTSFAAYTFPLKAMKALNASSFEYTQYLYAPSLAFSIFLWTAFVSVYGSGLVTILDWNNANGSGGAFYLLNLSNVLDFIRYAPIMVFTMISHQMLTSFDFKLSEFDRKLVVDGIGTLVPSSDDQSKSNDAGIPSNGVNGVNQLQHNGSCHHRSFSGVLSTRKCQYDEILEFNNLDHQKFIKSFSALIAPYRLILRQFSSYFAVIFVCNVSIWMCLVWNVVWRINKDSPCEATVWTEYAHAGTEVGYYVVMWMVPIWRLKYNHSLIKRLRDDFSTKVVVVDKGSHEKERIISYLDGIVHERSPFNIYGLTPTPTKIGSLFSVILGTLTLDAIQYARKWQDL